MGFSSLISQVVLADRANYTSGRSGYKICKITPHQMAGRLTGAQCAKIFQNGNRHASANYCIGYDGEIVGCVDETNRAWTSSNKANDCQAITIEVSNSKNGEPWPITDASWNALVKLCVDICKRYKFKLEYDSTPNGSLTRHNMFVNTNCPGQTLENKFNELVVSVNSKLNGEPISYNDVTDTNYTVKIETDCLNIRKGPGTNYVAIGEITDRGTYTIVKESNGLGASKWGKLKSGLGWISLDYIERKDDGFSGGVVNNYRLGLYVVNTSYGLNVRSNPSTDSRILKVYKNGTRFDTYEINGEWAKTPSGWVNLKYCSLVKSY